jgi:hypothetical protein
MVSLLQAPETVKTDLLAELEQARRAADAFYGAGPVAHFQGENRFDYEDPKTGHLMHRFDTCPYCRLRAVRRVIASLKGLRHDNTH